MKISIYDNKHQRLELDLDYFPFNQVRISYFDLSEKTIYSDKTVESVLLKDIFKTVNILDITAIIAKYVSFHLHKHVQRRSDIYDNFLKTIKTYLPLLSQRTIGDEQVTHLKSFCRNLSDIHYIIKANHGLHLTTAQPHQVTLENTLQLKKFILDNYRPASEPRNRKRSRNSSDTLKKTQMKKKQKTIPDLTEYFRQQMLLNNSLIFSQEKMREAWRIAQEEGEGLALRL